MAIIAGVTQLANSLITPVVTAATLISVIAFRADVTALFASHI